MMQAKFLSDALESIDANLEASKVHGKRRKKELRIKAKLMQNLEYKTGLSLCNSHWSFSSDSQSIEVSLGNMHDIKKVVGNVENVGTDLAHDYEETNDLVVMMRPTTGVYTSFIFEYRRKHRADDECQVEKIECKASSYNRLTCPTD